MKSGGSYRLGTEQDAERITNSVFYTGFRYRTCQGAGAFLVVLGTY